MIQAEYDFFCSTANCPVIAIERIGLFQFYTHHDQQKNSKYQSVDITQIFSISSPSNNKQEHWIPFTDNND